MSEPIEFIGYVSFDSLLGWLSGDREKPELAPKNVEIHEHRLVAHSPVTINRNLTPRQQQVYDFIVGFEATHQRDPLMKNIVHALGSDYTNIRRMIDDIEFKGHFTVSHYPLRFHL